MIFIYLFIYLFFSFPFLFIVLFILNFYFFTHLCEFLVFIIYLFIYLFIYFYTSLTILNSTIFFIILLFLITLYNCSYSHSSNFHQPPRPHAHNHCSILNHRPTPFFSCSLFPSISSKLFH